MKKAIIITFSVVLTLGLILSLTGLIMYGFNFNDIRADIQQTRHFQAVKHENIQNTFSNVRIDVAQHNVNIRQSSDEYFHLDYYYHREYATVTESIEGEQLHLRMRERFRFQLFQVSSTSKYSVNLHIPVGFDGNVVIYVTSGNVNVQNINVEDLTINLTSGNVFINNLNTDTVNVNVSSGNTTMNNTIAKSISVVATSGNTILYRVDSGYIRTVTTSGNNRVTVLGSEHEFRIELNTRSGRSTVGGQRRSGISNNNAPNRVTMQATSGNNTLNFVT